MEDRRTGKLGATHLPFWAAGVGVAILIVLGASWNGGIGRQRLVPERSEGAISPTPSLRNQLGTALTRFGTGRDGTTDELENDSDEPPAPFSEATLVPEAPASDTPLLIALEAASAPWEARLDALLSQPGSQEAKAAALLGLLPELPEEAYDRASREIAARVPPGSYGTMILPLLLNQQTHGAIASVLFGDLIERPSAVAIPALTDLARSPAHPFSESARQSLDLLLKRDLGTNE